MSFAISEADAAKRDALVLEEFKAEINRCGITRETPLQHVEWRLRAFNVIAVRAALARALAQPVSQGSSR